ncbi:MAG: acetyl-CoA carboxylase carboxyltransferase subunit beta [Acidobacteria bacterium]|nr:MAG: acetyl-CoA carboxylase carboxyltransferase subunit beta [Acidobacteriota bacterium]
MPLFRKKKRLRKLEPAEERTVRTEGVFIKCEKCREVLYRKDVEENLRVCPKCGYHFKISARRRLELLFDDGRYQEHDAQLVTTDPLNFVDKKSYKQRLAEMQKATGLLDAVITGEGTLGGYRTIIAAMEYQFIGGSMGSVVGEKIARAIERAEQGRMALIIVSCSGGARMMEGVFSLMQMAKIAAALARLDDARLPYISVLTDPTTGGVTASFAMLGDLNIAEPGALIGFAGPRVIQQTIRQKLPEGFQRSEFLLRHGMLDAVVPRKELRPYLIRALGFMMDGRR